MQQGGHGPSQQTQAQGRPEHRLFLLEALQAALLQAPGLASRQLELVLQQSLGEGVWRHHHQIVYPQAKGGQGLGAGGGKGQVGATIPIAPPKLPPDSALLAPDPLRQGAAEPLAPEGGNGSLGRGGKTLQQGCLGQQPRQTQGQGAGPPPQQQARKQHQQGGYGCGAPHGPTP